MTSDQANGVVRNQAEQIIAKRMRAWMAVWLSMAHANGLAAEKDWKESFTAFQETLYLTTRSDARLFRAFFLQDWA